MLSPTSERALMADPRKYCAQETVKDGTPVTIRAIRKDDKERIHSAFRALDREAVYRRFFAPKQDLTDPELEQVTDVDQRHATGEIPANVNHLLILSNPLYALTMTRAFRWLSCIAALKGLRSSSPQR
jgi:hypothetical protein